MSVTLFNETFINSDMQASEVCSLLSFRMFTHPNTYSGPRQILDGFSAQLNARVQYNYEYGNYISIILAQ